VQITVDQLRGDLPMRYRGRLIVKRPAFTHIVLSLSLPHRGFSEVTRERGPG
jgi:hypothetical protein